MFEGKINVAEAIIHQKSNETSSVLFKYNPTNGSLNWMKIENEKYQYFVKKVKASFF